MKKQQLNKPGKSRYTVVTGKYWITNPTRPRQGPQPDGDTIRFEPDSVDVVRALRRLSGRPADINNGKINVRYEGIDALETHFQGMHQDVTFANMARDRNLALVGYTGLKFFTDEPNVVESVDADPLPGYVIARGIESNGRLLGLVYAGTAAEADGTSIFVTNDILDRSVNVQLVTESLAYVEPYDSMPISMVKHFRAKAHAARSAGGGLWHNEGVNMTNSHRIRDLADLQSLVMWPKLFRRLAAYFAEGITGLDQFEQWIRDDPVRRDDALRLPNGEAGNMHDTFVTDGDLLKLLADPEDLLITPDPAPMPV